MFNIISKLGTLFYEEQDHDDYADSSVTAASGPHQVNLVQERTFEGAITSLHTGYGMVDHHIYCPIEAFGAFKPKVGERVTVKASRQHETAGWCATNITIHKEWEDIDAHETTKENLVGVVSAYNKGAASCVVGTSTLYFTDVTGFIPQRGDWIQAEVLKHSSGQCETLSLKPVRETDFEGTVTGLRQGFGYINNDTYFALSVLANGYRPNRGDFVCGRAVESQQGHCVWRAVTVTPKMVKVSNQVDSPTLNLSLSVLLDNKNGINIAENLDFGVMLQGSTRVLTVSIRNDSDNNQLLKECRVCQSGSSRSQFRVTGMKTGVQAKLNTSSHSFVIESSCTKYVVLECEAHHLGRDTQLVVFDFGSCVIGRYVSVEVKDVMQKSLQPSCQYERSRSGVQQRQDSEWVVPGQKVKHSAIRLPQRLPPYVVPDCLRTSIWNREDVISVAPVLVEELELDNYTNRFQTLLHVEEIQQEIEIREFDLERVCMRPFGEYLALMVPGLAEGRPSLLVGDKVFLSAPSNSGPVYEGVVHDVLKDEILLKFHQNFHSNYSGEDYNVIFQFNRTTLRRCHCAVENIKQNGAQVLFPSCLIPQVPQTKVKVNMKPQETVGKPVKVGPVHGVRKFPIAKLRHTSKLAAGQNHTFFNEKLNGRQKAAVMRILDGQCRPLPYVLFGPPGTGKTITIVEAVLQTFVNVSSSRIIACAPSNSAADLLTERLHNSGLLKPGDMVRLNAFYRSADDLVESIRPYHSNGEDLQVVSRHRILISTCSTVGMLYGLGIRSGHFTHAFIDEAGQATEPESMIAVGLVAPGGGQVVLAGDPMQLGPVLRSNDAKMFGLELSYLERLMSLPLYQRDERKFADHGCYDPLLVTKLVKNYRSHLALLQLPSQLFYHSELEYSADSRVVECLSCWPQLPNQHQCPLIFHGVRGEDLREGNSPSWFNPVEAVQVMHYLKALVSYDCKSVTWDDIGVITPYRKQVEKIRVLIDSLGMERVKVGSVEEFQGQERLAVIISTVRSNESMVSSDCRHNLGFLNSPKRFNVAITRAQALLVIIGNPHVLARDTNWRKLIQYCVSHKAYVGCDLPDSCSN